MKRLLITLTLVSLTMPSIVRAEFPHSEILLNGMQATLKAGSAAELSVTAGYNYAITEKWQIGLTADLLYTSVGLASGTTFDVLAGPTFNIPLNGNDIQNALYIVAKAGFELESAGLLSPVYFVFEASLGKRFEITHNFIYRPDVGVQYVNNTFFFLARALSFSYMF